MSDFIKNKQEEFNKALEFFKKEIAGIRTGRANPNMLEDIQVEAYGTKTPLQGVANINVPDGQSLLVTPWDKNISKDIERALVEAKLNVGVVNEGNKIRLSIPKMTEENRHELVKKINEKQESARVTIRQVRDDVKTAIESAEKDKQITEDDKFQFIKELDEEVNRYNEEVKKLRDQKEEEIMTI
ncbi:MAG: ribosome recycling factor [Patescibacteria group bacterium]|nr:ribosome recycling factor [Patescibacteria group bacterium]